MSIMCGKASDFRHRVYVIMISVIPNSSRKDENQMKHLKYMWVLILLAVFSAARITDTSDSTTNPTATAIAETTAPETPVTAIDPTSSPTTQPGGGEYHRTRNWRTQYPSGF